MPFWTLLYYLAYFAPFKIVELLPDPILHLFTSQPCPPSLVEAEVCGATFLTSSNAHVP